MVRRSFLTPAIMLLGVLLAPAIPAAGAADPTAMISNLGSRALEVLGKDATQSQRVERFRQLLREDFDVPGIARFVLGRYWNTATEEQRGEFTKLFEDYIAFVYTARLANFGGETFKTRGSRSDGDGVIVSTDVISPGSTSPLRIDWWLVNDNGRYKINDVIDEGVSMAVTQRSEFASIIQRNGGQLGGLIAMMREKTASAAY